MLSGTVPPVTQMEILIFSNKTFWTFIFQNLLLLTRRKVEICLSPQFLGHLPVCDGLKLQDSYIPINSVKFQLSRMLGKSLFWWRISWAVPAEVQSHVNVYVNPVHHHLSFLIHIFSVGFLTDIFKDSELHFYVRTSVWKCKFVCQNKQFDYFRFNSRVLEYVWLNSFWKCWYTALGLFTVCMFECARQTEFVHQWWDFFSVTLSWFYWYTSRWWQVAAFMSESLNYSYNQFIQKNQERNKWLWSCLHLVLRCAFVDRITSGQIQVNTGVNRVWNVLTRLLSWCRRWCGQKHSSSHKDRLLT